MKRIGSSERGIFQILSKASPKAHLQTDGRHRLAGGVWYPDPGRPMHPPLRVGS